MGEFLFYLFSSSILGQTMVDASIATSSLGIPTTGPSTPWTSSRIAKMPFSQFPTVAD